MSVALVTMADRLNDRQTDRQTDRHRETAGREMEEGAGKVAQHKKTNHCRSCAVQESLVVCAGTNW